MFVSGGARLSWRCRYRWGDAGWQQFQVAADAESVGKCWAQQSEVKLTEQAACKSAGRSVRWEGTANMTEQMGISYCLPESAHKWTCFGCEWARAQNIKYGKISALPNFIALSWKEKQSLYYICKWRHVCNILNPAKCLSRAFVWALMSMTHILKQFCMLFVHLEK